MRHEPYPLNAEQKNKAGEVKTGSRAEEKFLNRIRFVPAASQKIFPSKETRWALPARSPEVLLIQHSPG